MSYISKRQPELFGVEKSRSSKSVDVTEVPVRLSDDTTIAWVRENDVTIVDTRGVKAFNLFHIAGSFCYPEDHLDEILETGAPFNADKKVLVVCPRGDRSKIVSARLRAENIDAYSLEGGLLAWRNAGLPLERRSHGA